MVPRYARRLSRVPPPVALVATFTCPARVILRKIEREARENA